MSPRRLVQLITALLVVTQVPFAALRTVSKNPDDGGTYTKIMDAVNASEVGDEIVIKDFEVYEEQVTITKNNITIRSEKPTLNKKPVIKYQDKTNVGPTTAAEALIEDKITFDQNGALRVMRACGVKIQGLIVDGGGSAPFGYTGIWNAKDPLFHGNAAIDLWIAGDVTISNCEIRNAYFGINVKDRNEGGIFANSNPADLETWRVVPLSGFGKTGNHLIENNKIHNNNWGMFFESSWDLGCVIRYNLIYENHHAPKDIATISKMPDGSNQSGGAILYKDDVYSPLAIYNNTFYHNFLMLAAHWKVGYQHLIFNNIFAEPYAYWGAVEGLSSWMDVINMHVERTKHNLFACQQGAPSTQTQEYQWGMTDPGTGKYVEGKRKFTGISQVRITDKLDKVEIAGEKVAVTITLDDGTDTTQYKDANYVIQPGAAIIKPFAASTQNRWLEPKFQSEDPDDDNFLVPDWDDPATKEFIVDKGWAGTGGAGVVDEDGSVADIGAKPYTAMSNAKITIKATQPVIIKGTTATATFQLLAGDDEISNPKLKYAKWIDALPSQSSAPGSYDFGGDGDSLTKNNIKEVKLSKESFVVGGNTVTFTVDPRSSKNDYAFLEMVITGTNKNGQEVTSSVGFLPYRSLQYEFKIKLENFEGTKVIDTVHAGDTVRMIVIPVDSSGKIFQVSIDTAEATLNSSNILFNEGMEPFTFKRGFSVKDSVNYVVFTKVPEGKALEYASVSGKFMRDAKDSIGVAIRGTSEGFVVLPGAPDHVKFYDPPSGGSKLVNRGGSTTVSLNVFDKYDNVIDNDPSVKVSLESEKTDIGDVDGSKEKSVDSTGFVNFQVKVTGGSKKDTFPIVAKLVSNDKTDKANCIVGNQKSTLVILYGDTLVYNDATEIRGTCGDRFKVTIIAALTPGSVVPIAERLDTFDIEADFSGFKAFATEAGTDAISKAVLVNGKAEIWITSTGSAVSNGGISVTPLTNELSSASRANIYFIAPEYEIKSAAYYADNGLGQVDRVELHYAKPLKNATYLPDSIDLYWPIKDESAKMVVKDRTLMTIDPADSTHVTVKLDPSFDTSLTTYSGSKQLGKAYWKNPETPQAESQDPQFNIEDSVGPLLKSATILERLAETGDDEMLLTFTESVDAESIVGATLSLIKGTDTSTITIASANVTNGDTIRVTVTNTGSVVPKMGDQLKILSTGTIADIKGNSAHKDNRPVTIKMKQVPPDIDQAFYFDNNGDGVVDYLKLYFNKEVTKDSVSVSAKWVAKNISLKTPVSGKGSEDIQYLDDNRVIGVNIDGKFNGDVSNLTNGAMDITVTNTEFPGHTSAKTAGDKAGPVITKADYYPGMIGSEEASSDTIVIEFSEPVTSDFNENSFNLFSKDEKACTVVLKKLIKQSADGTQNTYEIDRIERDNSNFKMMLKNDSVNIVKEAITDKNENAQNVEDNKKVVVTIHAVTLSLAVKVGPIPFNPSKNEILKMEIKPKKDVSGIVFKLSGVKVIDRLGNVVYSSKGKPNYIEKQVGKLEIEWDGKNDNKRLVGAGTYKMIFDGTPEISGLEGVKVQGFTPEMLIGVKR